jgi:thiol-disulfide isomerase/thioredoxin
MEKRGSLKWFFVFFRAFYFLLICRLAKAMPHFSSQPSLYNSSDPITLLSTGDFKQTVLATSNAWLIEFYSSWCGHCIDFAPAFRELANDVKGLKFFLFSESTKHL